MTKLFALIVCIAFVLGCENDVVAQPKLIMQDTLNWGVVHPESDPDEVASVNAEVVLKNGGGGLLRIKEVRPGCGCTSAPLDKDSLTAGEETVMRIKLNLPTHNGPLHKTITVTTNDTLEPTRVLHLVADVQRPLQMSSSFIPFNKGKIGEVVEGRVTFSNHSDKEVKISFQSTDPDFVVRSTNPVSIAPNGEDDLVVSYTPKKEGPFKVEIKIQTDMKGFQVFSIYGHGSANP